MCPSDFEEQEAVRARMFHARMRFVCFRFMPYIGTALDTKTWLMSFFFPAREEDPRRPLH